MGTNGSLIVSLDGENWTDIDLSGIGSITNMDCIIYTSGRWIAFGKTVFETIIVTTDDDGVTLNQITPTDVGEVTMAAPGAGIIIASGNTAFLISDNNGDSWSPISYSNGSYFNPFLAFGNDYFIAAQSTSHATSPLDIERSVDGVSWDLATTLTDPGSTFFNLRFLNAKFYLVCLGVSGNSKLWTSDIGNVWTENDIGDLDDHLIDIAYGHGKYVAIQTGSSLPCMISTDGESFSPGGSLPVAVGSWQKIVFADDLFLAISDNATLAISTDGSSWTIVEPAVGSDVLYEDVFGH